MAALELVGVSQLRYSTSLCRLLKGKRQSHKDYGHDGEDEDRLALPGRLHSRLARIPRFRETRLLLLQIH